MVAGRTARRLTRDQFFDKLAGMDRADLTKLLWTLYWRGAAPLRERIEELIEPQRAETRDRVAETVPNAKATLAEVTEFAALARSGSYLAGDRRVSRQERSRWRHTFRRLVVSAAAHLVRWESGYGWTRRGDGWVSEREVSRMERDARCAPGRFGH